MGFNVGIKGKTAQSSYRVIAGISVLVTKKAIKNCYLRLDPATGQAKLSVPRGTGDAFIEHFITGKSQWIKHHQQRIIAALPTPYEYLSGEQHWLWGKPYTLVVTESTGQHHVGLDGDNIKLTVRPNTQQANRQKCLQNWYKQIMDAEITVLLEKWQPIMQQTVNSWQIRQMKSRWGTCHIHRRHIVLNADLVSKPKACLTYVLVHEMVHLYERYHNQQFYALMDKYLPEWRQIKPLLSASPSTFN